MSSGVQYPKFKLTCQDCGSDQCQRAEMVYDLGTTNTSAMSNTIGLGSFKGSIGALGGLTSTNTSVQSNFAARMAPPPQMSKSANRLFMIGWMIAVAFATGAFVTTIGLLFRNSSSKEGGEVATHFGAILMLCGWAYVWMVVHEKNKLVDAYNRDEWPKLMAEWRKIFVCLKCGRTWIP